MNTIVNPQPHSQKKSIKNLEAIINVLKLYNWSYEAIHWSANKRSMFSKPLYLFSELYKKNTAEWIIFNNESDIYSLFYCLDNFVEYVRSFFSHVIIWSLGLAQSFSSIFIYLIPEISAVFKLLAGIIFLCFLIDWKEFQSFFYWYDATEDKFVFIFPCHSLILFSHISVWVEHSF